MTGDIRGLVFTRWTVLMLIGAVSWFLSAAFVREASEPIAARKAGDWIGFRPKAALVGIGVTMAFVGLLHPQAEASSVSIVWLTMAAIAGLAHSVFKRVALDVYGLIGIAAAAVAWAVAYTMRWMDSPALLFLHPGLVSSVAIAGVWACIGAWIDSPRNPARPTERALLMLVVPAVVLLLFASTSLEVARVAGVLSSDAAARGAAVSIWWGLVAVALVVAGFWRRQPAARRTGLALLGVATAKALIFDLASVPPTWRVASFVGLGLLMLGVAVGYARVSARLTRSVPTPEGPAT